MASVHDAHLLDSAPSSSKVQPVRIGRDIHQRGASSSRSSAEEADHNQQVSVSQPPLSPDDLQDPLEPGSPDKLTDKMKRRLYLKEDPNYPNLSEKDRRRIRRRIANRESARRVRQKREDQLSDAQKQAMSYKAETVRLRQYVVKLEEQGRLLAKEAMHWRTKWTQSNYQNMQMYSELSASSRGGEEGGPSGQPGPHHPMEMTSQAMPGAAPGQQAPRPRMPKAQSPSPGPMGQLPAQGQPAGGQSRPARASPYQGQPGGFDLGRTQPMYPHEMSHLNQPAPGHQFDTAPLDVRMPSFGV
ncbi:hypothetical protein WJX84_000979 [Apatococcus fuscideae]|uniref:BZIP domain-containing protein n=1 Tax=Apatococcus fuscideae TaxID=2026836 RepID=A0AAW1T5C7_9CHLO